MKRISFTQTEVGIMNEIADYIQVQALRMAGISIVEMHVSDSLQAKAAMLKKILGEGVIEK